MQTPEQIIIGELQRLILMQAQEIKLLKARITDLERKVEQNSTRKNSTIALCHLLKMKIDRQEPAVFVRKAIVKWEDNPVMREKHWR